MLLLNRNAFLRQSQRSSLLEYFLLPCPTSCSSFTDGALLLLLPKNQLAPLSSSSPRLMSDAHIPIALLTLYNEICHTARSGERWRGGRQRSGEEEKKRSCAEEFAAFSEGGKRWQCVILREGARSQQHLACAQPAGAGDGRSARPTPSRAGWLQIALL